MIKCSHCGKALVGNDKVIVLDYTNLDKYKIVKYFCSVKCKELFAYYHLPVISEVIASELQSNV